jgi:hypothetical protein
MRRAYLTVSPVTPRKWEADIRLCGVIPVRNLNISNEHQRLSKTLGFRSPATKEFSQVF